MKRTETSPEKRYRSRIRSTIREYGFTQEWLAKRMGIRKETLSRKMNGEPFTEAEMRQIQRLLCWKSIEGEAI